MKDWVLITGASSGIGLELARCFAADQFPLILVARNEARLNKIAKELAERHGIQTRVVPQDLAETAAAEKVFEAVRDLNISILVNNAGLGFYGAFAGARMDEQRQILQVNINALVALTHLFVQPMLACRAGRILNVASTAAFQPGPLVNVYYASKAFVYSFSCALAEELAGSGVTVTALCPGTTHTDFFERGGFGATRVPFTMDPGAVAAAGYRGLMRGKRVVIPGLFNKITSALAKRMPQSLTTAVVKRIHSGVRTDA